jgi:hypothetical protein
LPSSEAAYFVRLAGRGVVPTQGSVAGEVDSRYALIAIERDAAPRVSECRPEIDEAIELYLLPPEADLAMQTHRRRRGIVSDEVRFRSSGPLLADIVAKVPKGAAANFPPKNETSDDRRSIGLQTRYQNRL